MSLDLQSSLHDIRDKDLGHTSDHRSQVLMDILIIDISVELSLADPRPAHLLNSSLRQGQSIKSIKSLPLRFVQHSTQQSAISVTPTSKPTDSPLSYDLPPA